MPYQELRGGAPTESSAEIRDRVERARAVQRSRGYYNRACPRASSARSAPSTLPASALSRWPSAAWAFPPARTTASSRSPAPSPTSAARTAWPPSTWPKPSSTAASTGITGADGSPPLRISHPAASNTSARATQSYSRRIPRPTPRRRLSHSKLPRSSRTCSRRTSLHLATASRESPIRISGARVTMQGLLGGLVLAAATRTRRRSEEQALSPSIGSYFLPGHCQAPNSCAARPENVVGF